MHTTLMRAMDWAQNEFGGAELGDVRRSRRLAQVAAALAENPRGTLPQSFDGWSQTKAAYRLLRQADVSHAQILAPHCSRVRAFCREGGEYLLVEDTTALDFTSHCAARDLGEIGDGRGRGLHVHSTLALAVHGWGVEEEPNVTALGLFAQRYWVRAKRRSSVGEKKSKRLTRSRESGRWASVFEETGGPPADVRWTYVADRESDIYEVFDICQSAQVAFIIRANQARALADEGGSVFEAAASAPVLGRFRVWLRSRPAQFKKAKRKGQRRRVCRPKQPGYTATLEVRSRRVTLRGPWRPTGRPAPFAVQVVEAREIDPPEGADPIHWVLLTDWPVEGMSQCQRVVQAYSCRWLIEEYHKALKTGTRVEDSQLSTADRIAALLGILAVVAVRLVDLKLQARVRGDQAVPAAELGPEVLAILEAKYGRPAGGWTYRNTLTGIAKLGGFLSRKNDGPPGWLTIWRGWQKLILMAQGFDLLQGEKCG